MTNKYSDFEERLIKLEERQENAWQWIKSINIDLVEFEKALYAISEKLEKSE